MSISDNYGDFVLKMVFTKILWLMKMIINVNNDVGRYNQVLLERNNDE